MHRPRPLLLAGLCALVLASGCASQGTPTAEPAPSASPSTSPSGSPSSGTDEGEDGSESQDEAAYPVVTLTAASASGRCAVPTAARLRLADGAWSGTVTDAGDGSVTVVTDRTWAGEEAGTLRLDVLDDVDLLLDGLALEVDEDVLVAASGSQVMVCGFSGEETAARTRLYERAFGTTA
ncbi:hypothetical protein [Nocardioides bruguierae]|uniref:Lipoprotein n=1 Tax=Nocardioides bruguierae TaxID=2945102 RepID=A0A9X2D625_9ACTN|nr:hypothetical protein [Nocardioides bruguierae]MCM0619846.1 hypothetical protein [Nocardioides bruguierae]